MSIDHHNLTIIASDGAPIQPVEAGAYGMTTGERFDFILDASAEIGKYWMRIKGRGCPGPGPGFEELALLVYEGAAGLPDPPEIEQPYPLEVIVNPFNRKSSEFVKNIMDLSAAGKHLDLIQVPQQTTRIASRARRQKTTTQNKKQKVSGDCTGLGLESSKYLELSTL